MFRSMRQATADTVTQMRLKLLEERYWELWHKHNRLMAYLNLQEQTREAVYIAPASDAGGCGDE